MAQVRCPACGLEGEAGAFCENCGPSAGRLAGPSPAPADIEVPGGMPFGAVAVFPEVMWRGVSAKVEIRFKAARDIYAGVCVSICNGTDELQRRDLGRRPGDEETRFSFNITPRMAGTSIDLTVRFRCLQDRADGADVFVAALPVRVEDQMAHTVNIDASTVVSGTGASVLVYGNRIGTGIELKDRRFDETGTVLRTLFAQLEESPRRLTLERDGEAIHLWALKADDAVVFGRRDTCDYAIRVYDGASGALDERRTSVISRRHMRLSVCNGSHMRLYDGDEAPSGWGTFVDGVEVGRNGVSLSSGAFRVTLGDRYEDGGVFAMSMTVLKEADGTLSGFAVSREDGMSDHIVAVVNRGMAFGDGTFSWNGRWFMFNGEKIIPGVSVDVAGNAYEVRAYHQIKR